MKTHKVKSWSYLFQQHVSGARVHDLRINDRDYKVGDKVILQEYDNTKGDYTGAELAVEITYATGHDAIPCAVSSAVLDPKYLILSYRKL